MLLGRGEGDIASLNGLTRTLSNVDVTKENGQDVWNFKGSPTSFVKIKGSMPFKSFTTGCFQWKERTEVSIIWAWYSAPGSYGTHFYIAPDGRVSTNLFDLRKTSKWFHTTAKVPAKKWVFVGMSYDHTNGNLLIWEDDQVTAHKAGVRTIDSTGDFYIGIFGRAPTWQNPFRGKIRGLSIQDGPITKDQISSFKQQTIEYLEAKEGRFWLHYG